MEIEQLYKSVRLNKQKIERIALRTNLCYHSTEENEKYLTVILRQIAINIHVIYGKFDLMTIEELEPILRENAILSFTNELYHKNDISKRLSYIQKNMRPQAKSKLLYIQNNLLAFVNSNKAS